MTEQGGPSALQEPENSRELSAFDEASIRTLPNPPIPSVHPYKLSEINALGENQSVPGHADVTVVNNHKPLKSNDCYGGTVDQSPNSEMSPEAAAEMERETYLRLPLPVAP